MAHKTIKSVCPYCGVGCGIVMEVEGDRIVKVSGDQQHPANYGRLCSKGHTCDQPLTQGRLEFAQLRSRREEAIHSVDVRFAIRETARRLLEIIHTHGPDAFAMYVSGQMSLEAQYLANKLVKGFIGTNNIESNSRLCMASAATGYKLSLGADAPPGSYQDFDQADLFLVAGSNMAECHPVLFYRMERRIRAGAKLIVVDPRRTALAEKASLFLQIRPGTDLVLLNGLLHLLIRNGRTDLEFIASCTEGWEGMPLFLEAFGPERVAEVTGLAASDIRLAAEWIGASPEWMSCWTMGLNQSVHGTWHTSALCNLHLATGAICRPGSGPFSLTGQPNAMGGREMGYMGSGLPGQRSVLNPMDRNWVEGLWGLPKGSIRPEPNRGTIAMFEEMKGGKIKACWIICTNPVASIPNRNAVIEALQATDVVIVQDAFLETETTRFADILLPGALWAEAEGVMINSERTLTLMDAAVPAPGDAMPDWEIIAGVASEMGYAKDFLYASASEVFEEIKEFWNPKSGYDLRGASYERLRENPLQWPCPPGTQETRHPIRYLHEADGEAAQKRNLGTRIFPTFPTADGRAVFVQCPFEWPVEKPEADYPLLLNTGRLPHTWTLSYCKRSGFKC